MTPDQVKEIMEGITFQPITFRKLAGSMKEYHKFTIRKQPGQEKILFSTAQICAIKLELAKHELRAYSSEWSIEVRCTL